MHVVFRTDASLVIGTGHVVRCLTLAEALRDGGASVSFICRLYPGHHCDQIAQRGFEIARLPALQQGSPLAKGSAPAVWPGAAWQVDADQTKAAIAALDAKPEWLVVDHYALEHHWEKVLRSCVRRIMVVDDLADRIHDCDLLLDDNLHEDIRDPYEGLVPEICVRLLGARYALLRKEFEEARRVGRHRDGTIRRVFVCFGGTDAADGMSKALRTIKSLDRPDLQTDVVVGVSHPRLIEIERWCRAEGNFHFHCQVTNMAPLMAAADLAISAGGMTSYELAFMGVPSLLLPASGAEETATAELARRGAAISLGLADSFHCERLAEAFGELDCSPQRCLEISRNADGLFDGMGVDRVIASMQAAGEPEDSA